MGQSFKFLRLISFSLIVLFQQFSVWFSATDKACYLSASEHTMHCVSYCTVKSQTETCSGHRHTRHWDGEGVDRDLRTAACISQSYDRHRVSRVRFKTMNLLVCLVRVVNDCLHQSTVTIRHDYIHHHSFARHEWSVSYVTLHFTHAEQIQLVS